MPGVCTMSWLRDEDGYDLFFNRDEKRARLPAEPPAVRRVGSTAVLAAKDGEAGGSWLAVNEHGLTLALLNGYLGADAATAPETGQWISRGKLVMDLSDCAVVSELAERLGSPVITTFKAKGLVSDHHPLGCGVLGRSGTPIASWFMNEADCLLVLGASFSNHTGKSGFGNCLRRMLTRAATTKVVSTQQN